MPIKNLKEMDAKFKSVSKTNILELHTDYRELVERILVSESDKFSIDMVSKTFQRKQVSGKKENIADYKQRIHAEFSRDIKERIEGDFENRTVKSHVVLLEKMGDGRESYVAFFVNRTIDIDEFMAEELLDNLTEYSDDQIRYMLQGLMMLIMKITALQTSDSNNSVRGEMLNNRFLLIPKFQHKEKFSLVSAFEPSCFLSVYGELCIDVSYRCMRLTEADQTLISGSTDLFLTDPTNKKLYSEDRKYDGRSNKDRPAYASGTMFPYTRIFALEYATKSLEDKLGEFGIPVQRRLFSPTLEVDSFAQSIELSNPNLVKRYLVKVPDIIEDAKAVYDDIARLYSDSLEMPIISLNEYKSMEDKSWCSFVFLNPIYGDESNSISYFNSTLRDKLVAEDNLKDFPKFNSTFQAYRQKCKDSDSGIKDTFFDPYTEEKIKQLERNLKRDFKPYVLQGLNIKFKDLKSVSLEDLKKDKSIAMKAIRVLSELAFKEAVYCNSSLVFKGSNFHLDDGDYCVSYIRTIKGEKNEDGEGRSYHGQVGLSVRNDKIKVVSRLFEIGSKSSLEVNAPYLKKVKKIYNESFFLHSVETNQTLTSYKTSRVPNILCNSIYDPVDEWSKHYKNVILPFWDAGGEKKNAPKGIFSKASNAKVGLLPYYHLPKRTKGDDLISGTLAYHHLFLSPSENGVYVLVTKAQPAGMDIKKQILLKNVVSLDKDGNPTDWMKSKLVGQYLNSHTVDILSINESAKTSLFTKLAKVLVEN